MPSSAPSGCGAQLFPTLAAEARYQPRTFRQRQKRFAHDVSRFCGSIGAERCVGRQRVVVLGSGALSNLEREDFTRPKLFAHYQYIYRLGWLYDSPPSGPEALSSCCSFTSLLLRLHSAPRKYLRRHPRIPHSPRTRSIEDKACRVPPRLGGRCRLRS